MANLCKVFDEKKNIRVEDKNTLRENLCDTPFNVNVVKDEIISRMWLDDTLSQT
jgi:hypothetical protein